MKTKWKLKYDLKTCIKSNLKCSCGPLSAMVFVNLFSWPEKFEIKFKLKLNENVRGRY